MPIILFLASLGTYGVPRAHPVIRTPKILITLYEYRVLDDPFCGGQMTYSIGDSQLLARLLTDITQCPNMHHSFYAYMPYIERY